MYFLIIKECMTQIKGRTSDFSVLILVPMYGSDTGTAGLNDIEVLHNRQERIQLRRYAGNEDDDRMLACIDNVCLIHITQLTNAFLYIHAALDFNQCQLAAECFVLLDMDNFYALFQLAHLLENLIQCIGIANRHDGNAGKLLINGRGNRQRIDVEAAATEQAGNASQYARIILYNG